MVTLMVLGFVHRTTADAAAEDLLQFGPDLLLEADGVAVVRCDDHGTVQVTTNHLPGGHARTAFWHALFTSLIFPSPATSAPERQKEARRLADVGLSASFQEELRTGMTPDTSALFLLVDDASVADRGRAAVARFGGTLLTTSLVPDVESRIVSLPDAHEGATGPRRVRPTVRHE
jgi:uncharacterized membrane protein